MVTTDENRALGVSSNRTDQLFAEMVLCKSRVVTYKQGQTARGFDQESRKLTNTGSKIFIELKFR